MYQDLYNADATKPNV
uniref:Uncharacterized protein n=2 Tax=Anguilla anguilla TaxID=7936 RepID=A0A0E9VGV1_ANGAN